MHAQCAVGYKLVYWIPNSINASITFIKNNKYNNTMWEGNSPRSLFQNQTSWNSMQENSNECCSQYNKTHTPQRSEFG